jgi:hypothetical protein
MAINFPATPADGDTHEGYVWVAAENAWRRLPEAPAMDIENLNNVSVTSPADGESLVYDSTAGEWVNADATVDVYDVDTLSTGYFMMPVGTEGQRPENPSNGYFRFNTDSGEPEWYSGTEARWILFRQSPTFELEYLVIAGGGGASIAGGGAGGYRSSVVGESSGGLSSAESKLTLSSSTYEITVGAGGAPATSGSDSVFASIVSTGGGRAGSPAGAGGSGGGAILTSNAGGAGVTGQGFAGGQGNGDGVSTAAGGSGGGAGQAGFQSPTPTSPVAGANGLASSITGTSVYRAGGGAAINLYGTSGAAGGLGGGGASGNNGVSGTPNTGGGGGAGSDNSGTTRGSGGSGVVIIKYPAEFTVATSEGITYSTSTIGDYKVTQFTAGTGTVTFS